LKPLESLDIPRLSSAETNKPLAFPGSAGMLSADRNPTGLLRREQVEGRKAKRSRRSALRLKWRRFFYSKRL
jgi:hypothetical protein